MKRNQKLCKKIVLCSLNVGDVKVVKAKELDHTTHIQRSNKSSNQSRIYLLSVLNLFFRCYSKSTQEQTRSQNHIWRKSLSTVFFSNSTVCLRIRFRCDTKEKVYRLIK